MPFYSDIMLMSFLNKIAFSGVIIYGFSSHSNFNSEYNWKISKWTCLHFIIYSFGGYGFEFGFNI